MHRGPVSLVWPSLVALLAAGCEGAISGAGAGDAEATTTHALVVVERTVDSASVPRVQASARFARFAASSGTDDAMRAIGAAIELPTRGACAPLGASSGEVGGDESAPIVELVDVGSVSIEADGVDTHLGARQLPDVTDVVSGVVYARTADPTVFPPSTRYVVHVGHTAGPPGLAPFDVEGSAPADPNDVHVAGEPPAGGVLSVTGAVDVSWAPDASGDTVYVDVQPAGVRCTLGDGSADADAARATLPVSLLGAEGTLLVHRLHREVVRAASIAGGEVRFDFARSVAYARR
jgi:hypothetical protein